VDGQASAEQGSQDAASLTPMSQQWVPDRGAELGLFFSFSF
jgi:hypothetical protein